MHKKNGFTPKLQITDNGHLQKSILKIEQPLSSQEGSFSNPSFLNLSRVVFDYCLYKSMVEKYDPNWYTGP